MSDHPIKGPISTAPAAERVAGQYARATEWHYRSRGLAAVLLVLVIFWIGIATFGFGWGLLLVEAFVIAACIALDARLTPLIERWSQGAEGEERVGRVLDGLHGSGWFALHDVSTGRGNVDHVLIGPGGIYTIETKSHEGRIRTNNINRRMLKQAYAQAKWIERITGLRAEPLLVFSDAYLIPAVSRREGVLILPARMLVAHLQRRDGIIPPERVAEVYERLARALPA